MKNSPRFMHCHVFVPADLTRGVLLIYKCQIAGRRSHSIRIKLKQNRTCFKQNHRRVPKQLICLLFFLHRIFWELLYMYSYPREILFKFIVSIYNDSGNE